MEKRKPDQESPFITEGAAKIYQHEIVQVKDSKEKTAKQEVFYNKVQVFNRDLTLLCIVTHSQHVKEWRAEKFRRLRYYDAFTASGLRALRARLELPEQLVSQVVGCDISDDAIKNFKNNLVLNDLSQFC